MSLARVALRHTPVVIVMALAMLLVGVLAWNKVAPSNPTATASKRTTNTPDTTAGGFFGKSLPGAPPLDAPLVDRLKAAWEARDSTYKPRTRHLNPDGSAQYTNRLFLESSPYLLQHAHNPLSWYPWGDEAFETARKLGRPVLLSVGYSTCHWCHVMEEESFDDEEIARYLNEHYIAIKVDREERPDIDAIYMSAVQAMTGHGGWPMTVWLTPDRKPFYGGTYFPARDGDRGTRVGFLTLLKKLTAVYTEEPDRVVQSATQLAQIIQANLAPGSGGENLPDAHVLQAVADIYRQRFDSTYGGLQGAPKFPSSLPVRLLLRHYRRTGDQQSLAMATLTLEKMAAGGMYDHVGGGFHRYSTDAQWLVPHFEKMLYDNALLTVAYLEGYQVTKRKDFAQVARETLRYVERDMTLQAFGEILQRAPSAVSELLLAVDYHLDTPKEIVIVTPKSRAEAEPFLAQLRTTFLPNRILTVVAEGEDLAARTKLVPLVASKVAQGGKATAYVCEKKVCALPTTDPAIFAKQISQVRPLNGPG